MHRSRLSTFVIDCKGMPIAEAARFWSAVLGRKIEELDGKYARLAGRDEEPMLLVQEVEHDGRVHLDVESDDVEAEVRRLEALGARRVAQIRTFWILEAPTGQRFCVVRPQRGPLGDDANRWDDGPAGPGHSTG